MSEVRSVGYCENLVAEIEAWSPAQFAACRRHAKYAKFMDEYLTAKCTVDFWWFLVYGVYHRAMKHYDPSFHRRAARWLMDWEVERQGIRVPTKVKWEIWNRNSCKTQFLIPWDVWQFVRDRNARGIVRAYIDPKAQQITAGVMELILEPSFQRRWPHVRPATKGRTKLPAKWTSEEFLLERDDKGVRASSLVAFGLDGEPTGDHYHFGHYDDIEVKANASSDKLREQLFSVWRNDDNLFEAGSRRVCAGTPWDRAALVHGILHRTNGMEHHDYDVFRVPCWYKAFDSAFVGHEPVLLVDRRTIRVAGAGYPTLTESLVTCQARVRFWSDAAADVVEEIREVVWNDGEHFRVNRPFPEFLRQPLSVEVGPYKPNSPIRDTMDSVDYVSGSDVELPPMVEAHKSFPGVIELNNRVSLPAKRKEQGPSIFTAQMLLEAVSDSDRIVNPDDIKIVTLAEVPAGERRYYRAIDCARGDDKRRNPASTAMTTGFYHASGLYITHIALHQTMGSNAKLLELVLGVLRVKEMGGKLRETLYELSSAIEATLKDFLPQCMRDPFKYFSELAEGGGNKERRPFETGPTYAELAGRHFTPGERVPVLLRGLPRKQAKLDRIDAMSPECEAGRIHILDTCPHIDALLEQMKSCTWGATGSFDLLDTIADLVAEYGPKRKMHAEKEKTAGEGDYDRLQRLAMERALLTGGGEINAGWR